MARPLLDHVEAAAGLAVFGAADPAAGSTRDALVRAGVPGLLAGADPTLWGPAAEAGARGALSFLDTRAARQLLPQLAELRAELADLDRVVVAAAPGAAEAAEAVAGTLGLRLTVLAGAGPSAVRRALRTGLRRTLLVVAGASPATDACLRVFLRALIDAGTSAAEAGRHAVVLAAPGSPLAEEALATGAYLLPAAAPTRFAGLSAHTLVPAALAGADVAELLDQAEALLPALRGDDGNPGLALGAALAGARDARLVPDGSGLAALGGWLAPLLDRCGAGSAALGAGATGPAFGYGGALLPGHVPAARTAAHGPLGAQFTAWAYAAALAAHVRGLDPFAEPAPALDLSPAAAPAFTEGAVRVHTGSGAGDLAGALRDLLTGDGPVTVGAVLDRDDHVAADALGPLLAAASARPVTLAWGAGATRRGALLQLTAPAPDDLPVPGRPYTLGGLEAALAAGDRRAAAAAGRDVLHLDLADPAAGLRQVLAAAETLQA
ncbi:glucose-6-phosphate isomerase [Spirilliplanes yamanashiensis]|uniref:Glucose-6-phosphate isomerase n=1 Tax=Spirilliplanes yamanashiensis TaxID=42233 RepID=A0A8J3Y8C4_9ACTN|nr:glucose-6-phosphate isomerase [Spirilliplanes yamanashiensis]MDP9817083.1 glucose-6-phosphate isomerase [Spirilliplanes yamanashiensis]GIJ03262.1 glucose-6-phosphate isomerase [Spirilliplanes yamanashiensis]